MQMIKAILFDLDGTLINTNHLIMESFKHAFKTYLNIEVAESEIVKFFGEPLERSMGKFGEENKPGLLTTFKEFNEKMHDVLAKEYEGVEEALHELKSNEIKLGVVTSKRRIMAYRSLKLIRAFDYMDVIITPEDTGNHKPHPEPILKACEALGVEPEESLMVGDSIYDIQCGVNAGSATCAVTYTEFSMEEINKLEPDYFVDNLSELLEILNSHNGTMGEVS
jgi:pyrophosphatase PpaX